MNHRPQLQQPNLVLPNLPGYDEALWDALMQIARTEQLREWTLIGGQMVLLHALENEAEPPRFSTDIDVLVNARVTAGGIRGFVKTLESCGFALAGESPDGVAHRYQSAQASIDVLAPDGLGQRET